MFGGNDLATIRLEGLSVFGHHGARPYEKEAGQRLEIIDEELAFEVVGLVLKRATEKFVGLVFHQVSRQVKGAGSDLPGSPYFRINTR